MKYGRYGWPYLVLRVGVGISFIYMGADMLVHSAAWVEYTKIDPALEFDQTTWLRIVAFVNLAVGLMLIMKWAPKLAGGLATVFLLLVLTKNGLSLMLPGNIGLLGSTTAIALWPSSYHKRKGWWSRRGKQRSNHQDIE